MFRRQRRPHVATIAGLVLLCTLPYCECSHTLVSQYLRASEGCKPWSVARAHQCSYVREHATECLSKQGLFNYMELHYCVVHGRLQLSLLIFGAWILVLFVLLVATAEHFFCPALEIISDFLNLSPTVAGATLLALGNAAPDIFTQLAGVTQLEVSLAHFLKDVLFYMAALGMVFLALMDQYVQFWEALLLGAIYLLYLAITLYAATGEQPVHADPERHEVPPMERVGSAAEDLDSLRLPLLSAHEEQLQGSQHHAVPRHNGMSRLVHVTLPMETSQPAVEDGVANGTEGAPCVGRTPFAAMPSAATLAGGGSRTSGALCADTMETLGLAEPSPSMHPAQLGSPPSTPPPQHNTHPLAAACSHLPNGSPSISPQQGTSGAPDTDDALQHSPIDHHTPSGITPHGTLAMGNPPCTTCPAADAPVALLQGSPQSHSPPAAPLPHASPPSPSPLQASNAPAAAGMILHLPQLASPRPRGLADATSPSHQRGQHRKWSLDVVLQAPIVALLSLAMPRVSNSGEPYPRAYASLLPLTCPLLLLIITDMLPTWLGANALAYGVLCTLPACAVVLFVYPTNGIVRGPLKGLFTVMAFVLSMVWMSSAASELVAVCAVLGRVLGLPASVLGATVLAWGNSLSDMVADASLARDGYPSIAVTACFASPLFSLTAGLSISFASCTWQQPLRLDVDRDVIAMYVFALLNMAKYLVAVPLVFRGLLGHGAALTSLTFYAIFQALYVLALCKVI